MFLPGESHGQRRLVGYRPEGCKRVRHSWAQWQQITLLGPKEPIQERELSFPHFRPNLYTLTHRERQCEAISSLSCRTACCSRCSLAQSCLTPLQPSGCTPLVHGVPPARILEWAAMTFTSGSSQPRDWTHTSLSPALPDDSLPLSHRGSPQTPLINSKISFSKRK